MIVSVYDADTIRVDIDLGFGLRFKNLPLRLAYIDAPELNTEAGIAARDYLRVMLPVGATVIVQTLKDKKEKYGRYLAVVYRDGLNVNDALVNAGHAVLY